jgi:predicted phage baseplate assembly protein
MRAPRDCCSGIAVVTPQAVGGRPGLPSLPYRVGTHGSFLETMIARLTTVDVTLGDGSVVRPLNALTTRDPGDPSIALLDAWACVGDVLTFYQERIANEGFLQTATTRRSVLELARLVGYRLRPGVAATVYLAFTVDAGFNGVLPAGTRAQSIPSSGGAPQFFETAADLVVRDEWNAVRPRQTAPQAIGDWNFTWVETVYFAGIATKLKPQDAILIVVGDGSGQQAFRRVKAVDVEAAENRTRVTLELDDQAYADALQDVHDRSVALQALLHPVTPSSTQSFLTGPLQSRPAARVLATGVETLRTDATALAQTQPVWSVALRVFADKLESIGRAHFPEWPVVTTPQSPVVSFNGVRAKVLVPPTVPPASPERRVTSPSATFDATSDTLPRLLAGQAWKAVYDAWGTTRVKPLPTLAVYALRIRAALYGHNARPSVPTGFTIVIEGNPTGPFVLHRINVGGARHGKVGPLGSTTLTLSNQTTVAATVGQDTVRFDFESPQFTVDITRSGKTPTWNAHVGGSLADPTRLDINFVPQGNVRVDGTFRGDYDVAETPTALSLDAVQPHIAANDWIVVETPPQPQGGGGPFLVERVSEATRADYGLSVRGTRIELPPNSSWLPQSAPTFDLIRGTTVYAGSEELALAEEPIPDDVAGDEIPVDALYGKLDPGRWLIVAGERTDITSDGAGVQAGELVMLAGVSQKVLQTFDSKQKQFVNLPGDTLHSTFRLATPLAYRYKRDTVTISANVAKATHGQTVVEVLGNGDASRPLQAFALHHSPLTYVASAATPAGAQSTLSARVDEVAWDETANVAALGPADRAYTTQTDDADTTMVIFGNGTRGARVPTGTGNVSAQYRFGIGGAGNVAAGQISQLATRPPGAKAVVNPLGASGGADREDRDSARRNAPLAVAALERLVSEHDYADFARRFAGIGKADAVRLTDGRRQVVHVTIAGVGDAPIDPTSDLHRALTQAFVTYGDPWQPAEVAVRSLQLLVIRAGIRIDPHHQWEVVSRAARAALLEAFRFDRRGLGQPAFHSEAIAVIQGVAGVVYVELDIFDALPIGPQTNLLQLVQTASRLHVQRYVSALRARRSAAGILPAELVMLSADLHDSIMLRQVIP